MNRCDRIGCGGELDATGYCTVCLRPPLVAGGAAQPGSPPPAVARTAAPVAAPAAASTPASEPASIPRARTAPPPKAALSDSYDVRLAADPGSSALLDNPSVPLDDRRCSHCGRPVGRGHGGQPGLLEGRCPKDGTPYSFAPELDPGDVLADRYRIEGCLGHGGLGWVYLARDRNLEDRPVAIKALIAGDDPASIRAAEDEKRFLIELRHPDIVLIHDFVTHTPQGRPGRGSRGYIVMEYVPGLPLTSPHLPRLGVEQVLWCGLRILNVFRFLHENGYLFCDLKPGNVMAYTAGVKLIDLGAVRRIGQRGTGSFTTGYAAPELTVTGPTVATDLYTVGQTLHDLCAWSPANTEGPEYASLRLFLDRALDYEPHRRFASAAAMADQLSGVLAELTARRTKVSQPTPSALFARSAALVDNGWGAVPEPRWWMTGSARALATGSARPLDLRPAPPAATAAALARPRPDPSDPAAGFLTTHVSADPAAAARQLAQYRQPTAAVHLSHALALIQCGEPRAAEQALERAKAAAKGRARMEIGPKDWRFSWHAGVLALASGRFEDAEREFTLCRRAIPGEPVPLLALALCGEYRSVDDAGLRAAAERYRAVWRWDDWQESAALGCARVLARLGDRPGALAVLDQVPDTSPHRGALSVAALRVRLGVLRAEGTEDDRGLPGAEDLVKADAGLDAVAAPGTAERHRLELLVLEAALAMSRGPDHAKVPGLRCAAAATGERELRLLLAKGYGRLARETTSENHFTVLIDLANAIRPLTVR